MQTGEERQANNGDKELRENARWCRGVQKSVCGGRRAGKALSSAQILRRR